MLGFEHTETVEILRRLHDSKEHSIYSLTNWSNETFPVALKKFPFLSWFKGILVSGDVGLKKPDPEIYKLLLDRYGLEANTCVFIDDRTENVKAASALGFSGIVFKNHTQLSKDLKKLNII
jgi:2-haloacid dehalogenase